MWNDLFTVAGLYQEHNGGVKAIGWADGVWLEAVRRIESHGYWDSLSIFVAQFDEWRGQLSDGNGPVFDQAVADFCSRHPNVHDDELFKAYMGRIKMRYSPTLSTFHGALVKHSEKYQYQGDFKHSPVRLGQPCILGTTDVAELIASFMTGKMRPSNIALTRAYMKLQEIERQSSRNKILLAMSKAVGITAHTLQAAIHRGRFELGGRVMLIPDPRQDEHRRDGIRRGKKRSTSAPSQVSSPASVPVSQLPVVPAVVHTNAPAPTPIVASGTPVATTMSTSAPVATSTATPQTASVTAIGAAATQLATCPVVDDQDGNVDRSQTNEDDGTTSVAASQNGSQPHSSVVMGHSLWDQAFLLVEVIDQFPAVDQERLLRSLVAHYVKKGVLPHSLPS